MLHLGNSSEQQAWGGAQTFKALVYDKFCQDVIAPLYKIYGLRNQGVSVNVSLLADRGPMPDVPAVYFVEPTEANVKRIIEDITAGLYESYYINFASSVPRSLLQELARGTLKASAANKVAGVFDRYVSFVSLSPALFSLNMPDAYARIHSPKTSDEYIQRFISRLVDGLLSVLITTKSLPVIRCPASDPVAEMVARALDERIREMLRTGGAVAAELFAGGSSRGPDSAASGASGQRPLLCIFDRDLDLVTMLHHTWTYQAMAHDVLGMKLNKVTVQVDGNEEATAQSKSQTFYIDESDSFWAQHAGEPFPNVAAAVHEAIEEYNQRRADMTSSGQGDDPMGNLTAGLASAFSAIPEMTEKKRCLDMHTNIATALLNSIKARDLANLFEVEDQFASQSLGASISQMEQLLKEDSKGTTLDKTRALMVLYLTKPSISPGQLQGLLDALQKLGGDTYGVAYLRQLSSMKSMMMQSAAAASSASALSGASGPASLMNSIFSKGEGLLSAGFSSIQNVIQQKRELVICQVLESLMEQKPSALTENYIYLDPKAPPASPGVEVPRIRTPFRRSLAFMIGGGSYAEMQSVMEWAQAKGKQVTYGCTDLVSPEHFVNELCHLGRAQSRGGDDPDLS